MIGIIKKLEREKYVNNYWVKEQLNIEPIEDEGFKRKLVKL